MVVIRESKTSTIVRSMTEKCIICPECDGKLYFWEVLGTKCYKCGEQILPYDMLLASRLSRIAYYLKGRVGR
jgi:hypothetical protein